LGFIEGFRPISIGSFFDWLSTNVVTVKIQKKITDIHNGTKRSSPPQTRYQLFGCIKLRFRDISWQIPHHKNIIRETMTVVRKGLNWENGMDNGEEVAFQQQY
jgi:hypothetical protein